MDFPTKPTPWPQRSQEKPEGKAVHTGKAKGRAVERGRKGGHRKGGSGKDKAARTHGTRQPTHPAGSVANFGTLLLPTALIPPPALPPRPMPLLPSYARLGVFAKGVAHGLAVAGWKAPSIAPKLRKTDGTAPTPRSVNDVLAQLGADGPPWDDAPKAPHPGGVPRSTTPALDKKIRNLVFKSRGTVKVTVPVIKKKLKAARAVCDRTIQRRLVEAVLAYMRRRRKTLLTKGHRDARVCFAKWVLGRQTDWLRQWAYTDGTTFYIARSEPGKTSSGRMALGAFVWRMADGTDGLYEDCIGLLRNFHRDSRRQVGVPQV